MNVAAAVSAAASAAYYAYGLSTGGPGFVARG
jgi:hypothetical protein